MPKKTIAEPLVLTRKQGVREENTSFKWGKKYYPESKLRTPEARESMDKSNPPARIIRKGLQVKSTMESKYLKSKGY
jgi:hypothetical protein